MRSALLLAAVALTSCEAKMPDAATAMASEPIAANVTEQPEPVPSPAIATKQFQAVGTEPFWSVEVTPGQLRYSDPENIYGTTLSASESRIGQGRRYSGTINGQPISLLIEPGTCSDGMSDTVYPWKAVLTLGERILQGCARER